MYPTQFQDLEIVWHEGREATRKQVAKKYPWVVLYY